MLMIILFVYIYRNIIYIVNIYNIKDDKNEYNDKR